MKKIKALFLVAVISIAMVSCYSTHHTVGKGATGNNVETEKQWYALWGLVPINNVDSKNMVGSSTDYEIETKHTFVDYVISAFTSLVTISVQTVEVTK